MDDTGATRDDLKVPEGDVGDECNNATAEGRDIMVRPPNIFPSLGGFL